MSTADYHMISVLVTLAAALAYINARFLKLPSAIGMMAIAMVGSLVLITIDALGIGGLTPRVEALLDHLDFGDALLHGMLGLLLFAGALHVQLSDLAEQKWVIAALALGGILISTALIGGATYLVLELFGVPMPFIYCLLFGALISPTDPIAVLGILRSAGAPKRLETAITGESLFNDGVGVVVFITVLGIAVGGEVTASDVAVLFVREALGGIGFGLVVGYVGFRLLRSIDQYSVEVLLTLAMVFGGYAAAEVLHVSAPIAAVVSGLLIGNQGRRLAMSDKTREHLDTFWELVDEILNAVLFLVIGLEVVHLEVTSTLVLVATAIVPLVLLVRFVSVSIPLALLPAFLREAPGARRLLTWGGLRGGISVALALSLPAGPEREVILFLSYVVVAFSVLIQGLTVGSLVRRLPRGELPTRPADREVTTGAS